jgi:hypothetical protein
MHSCFFAFVSSFTLMSPSSIYLAIVAWDRCTCVLLYTVLKPADALDILKAVALAADLANAAQATTLLPIVYNVLLHVIAPASADTSADAAALDAAAVRRHVYVI